MNNSNKVSVQLLCLFGNIRAILVIPMEFALGKIDYKQGCVQILYSLKEKIGCL